MCRSPKSVQKDLRMPYTERGKTLFRTPVGTRGNKQPMAPRIGTCNTEEIIEQKNGVKWSQNRK